MRKWFIKQKDQLLNLDATPHSIALGFAIGFFWGATPLFGLKTLLGILNAWFFRGNKISAVVGVTIHDIASPFLPGVLLIQYQVGHWILSDPHHFGGHLPMHSFKLEDILNWTTFFGVGFPLLLGSAVLALPLSFIIYFMMKGIVYEYQKTKEKLAIKQNETIDSP